MADQTFRDLFKYRLAAMMGEATQDEYAKKIGVSRQSLHYYLNGERMPNAEQMYKICKATGCSADWLLGTEKVLKWKHLPEEQEPVKPKRLYFCGACHIWFYRADYCPHCGRAVKRDG